LSRRLYEFIPKQGICEPLHFEEIIGKGIEATFAEGTVKLGSSQYLNHMSENTHKKPKFMLKLTEVTKEVISLIINIE